jgi:glycosyltransferase involved in cell wall biosynthesis
VVTHHDSTTDRFPELFSNAAAIRRRLMKTYARADRVICISAASQADLLHYYDVAPERTEVIHHGFTPLPETPEAEASLLLPEQRYLLYVGARHSYKNFLAVLAALGQQKDKSLQLLVAGGGDFTAAEASAINRLGLGARVHLLARVTEHQMAAAYRGATLFVYPSLYEGFGFPPLEAMSVGCPALVSRIPALLEVCEDGAFYFDSANVEELADLIARLNFDESLRLTKKDAGFAQLRKYTWAKAGKQTLTAYRRAIDERHT